MCKYKEEPSKSHTTNIIKKSFYLKNSLYLITL